MFSFALLLYDTTICEPDEFLMFSCLMIEIKTNLVFKLKKAKNNYSLVDCQ